MATKLILLFTLVVTIAHAAKLPSYFMKCKKSDPELNSCLLKNANDVLHTFALGDSAHHIQSLSPLRVPFIHIDINGGLIINVTDAFITGIEQSVFSEVNIDLEKHNIYMKFAAPYIKVEGMYDINGKILILPITGNGPLNVTYIKPSITFEIKYDIKERNNKEYITPKSNTFVYTPERVYFQLDNLFNGDERLGNEMSKFLNENWKEVNGEIGTKLGEALGEILTVLLGNFFNKIPISEMFDS